MVQHLFNVDRFDSYGDTKRSFYRKVKDLKKEGSKVEVSKKRVYKRVIFIATIH